MAMVSLSPSTEKIHHGLEALHPHSFSPEAERRVIRRVDWRMLPLMGLAYSFSLIDRTNLAIARVAGLADDLHLDQGQRYSIVSCVYFIPYILLQLPSNIMLRTLGARVWLTVCIVGWGAAQIGMGFVPTWGLLALCRILLGAFEAGFYPVLVFIITTWYKRQEVQKRLALFYLVSLVFGGFSAIFAYALTLLKGRGGLNGWAWIFVVDGLITVALGASIYLFVVDFPHRNNFLSPAETALILARVEEDRGDSLPDKITAKKILRHLGDWTLWAFGLMYMCATMPAYAIGFFATTIISSMGWDLKATLLLTAPPFVFAAISTFFFSWLSDLSRKRALFLALQTLVSLTGLCVIAYAKPNGVRYFGIFLTTAGSSGCIPGLLAYNANNVVSHSKRAVSTAVMVAFGGVGGVFATTAYRQQDAPRYMNGLWATIGCQILLLVLMSATTITFSRRNQQAERGKFDQPLEGQPGFRYTL